jgi:hypothetical protein
MGAKKIAFATGLAVLTAMTASQLERRPDLAQELAQAGLVAVEQVARDFRGVGEDLWRSLRGTLELTSQGRGAQVLEFWKGPITTDLDRVQAYRKVLKEGRYDEAIEIGRASREAFGVERGQSDFAPGFGDLVNRARGAFHLLREGTLDDAVAVLLGPNSAQPLAQEAFYLSLREGRYEEAAVIARQSYPNPNEMQSPSPSKGGVELF